MLADVFAAEAAGQELQIGAALQAGGDAQRWHLLSCSGEVQLAAVLDDVGAAAGEGFRQVEATAGIGAGLHLFGDVAVKFLDQLAGGFVYTGEETSDSIRYTTVAARCTSPYGFVGYATASQLRLLQIAAHADSSYATNALAKLTCASPTAP